MTQNTSHRAGTTNSNVCALNVKATTRRILVVANETIGADMLHAMIGAERDVEIHVVSPALNTRIRHWTSDEDGARCDAAVRLAACVDALDHRSVRVHGRVGDADPICAIADSLVRFDADEMLIATPPEHRSNWLARDLAGRAARRFALPITHAVVEHDAPANALPATSLRRARSHKRSRAVTEHGSRIAA